MKRGNIEIKTTRFHRSYKLGFFCCCKEMSAKVIIAIMSPTVLPVLQSA